MDPTRVDYFCEWSSEFFNGDTPALRTLHLERCPSPWYSLNLNSLTTLSLREVPVEFRQNTTEFLASLSHMHNLMDLYLDDSLASASSFLFGAAFHGFQKINLPRLAHLSIIAPLSTVNALVSCINIPLKTDVKLGPDCGWDNNLSSLDDHALLCSLLARRYSMTQYQPQSRLAIRSLVIKYPNWRYDERANLTFRAWECDCDSCPSIPCVEWDCTTRLQVLFSSRQSTNDTNRLIGHICRSMPLSHVQNVHVLNPPLFLSFRTDVVGRLQNLRSLRLSDGSMPDLVSVLSLPPPNCVDPGQTPIFAPALEELIFHKISFWTAVKNDMTRLLESLRNALSTHREPEGQLTVTECVERISDRPVRRRDFNLEGWWGDGQFVRTPTTPMRMKMMNICTISMSMRSMRKRMRMMGVMGMSRMSMIRMFSNERVFDTRATHPLGV